MEEEDLVWIPRGVRDKLDRAGIRIHLADWQAMSMDERRELVGMSCDGPSDVDAFRSRVLALVRREG